MMEMLRRAAEETRQRGKEMQQTVDMAGGWDNMVKKANQGIRSMHKQQMDELERITKTAEK